MKKIVLGICLLTMTLSLNGCNNKNTMESINLNKQNETIDIIKEEIETIILDELIKNNKNITIKALKEKVIS